MRQAEQQSSKYFDVDQAAAIAWLAYSLGRPCKAIRELAAWITREIGQVDVVVNNAAILLDEGGGILDTSLDDCPVRANRAPTRLATNCLSA